MSDILTRKCAHCKEEIYIERYNPSKVMYLDKKYYHSHCLMEMATKKATSKRGKPAQWQKVLDDWWRLENETKRTLEHSWAREDLNDWLIRCYDIAVVPSRFWQIITELEQGKYKSQRCKPVDIATILGAWRWGQKKLNEIDINNKKNHRGPIDDNARLMYDLSNIVNKIPNYLSHLAKTKALEAETQQIKNITKINYDNLEKQVNNNQLDDISNMLDEFF